MGEFGGVSFGVARLIQTFPVVIQALSNWLWFGVLAVTAAAGGLAAVIRWRRPKVEDDAIALCWIAAMVLALIGLYASHVRSAYQLAGMTVLPFDFMHYPSNIGVPLSILAGSAVRVRTLSRVSPNLRWCVVVVCLSFIVWSAAAARELRNGMIKDEIAVRREPTLAAIELARTFAGTRPIVTVEPLLVQVYGPPSIEVVSLPALTDERVDAFGGKLLYLSHDRYNVEVDKRRHAIGLGALPAGRWVELQRGEDWTIWGLGEGAP